MVGDGAEGTLDITDVRTVEHGGVLKLQTHSRLHNGAASAAPFAKRGRRANGPVTAARGATVTGAAQCTAARRRSYLAYNEIYGRKRTYLTRHPAHSEGWRR